MATGQIFSKSQADQMYGKVLESEPISTSLLNQLMTQTTNYLMFKIISGTVYVLGDNRVVLQPPNQQVGDGVVFTLFSISVIKDLLTDGGDSDTAVEQREEVLTLTNGNYTLNTGTSCPPNCDPG